MAPAEVLKVSTREGRFPNGMRVIFETAEDSAIAGVALAIEGGSAKDPEGQAGLAHLVEHCVFQARHGDTPSVQQRLRELAAHDNASTTHDLVEYHAFVANRAFEGVLQIIKDIATDPLSNVDDVAFAHEKQVVDAERGLRNEDAQGQIQAYLYGAMFPPGHPYARPVSGTQDSVAQLTLDKARQFVARTYDPKQMTLYVAAPSSLDAFSRVSEAFAKHAGGPLASVAATTQDTLSNSPPTSSVGPLIVHEAALPFPELWLSWPLPASTLQDRAQAELLANLTDTLVRPTYTSHPAVARAGCELNEEALSAVVACHLSLNDASDAEGILNRTLTDLRNGFRYARINRDWVWTRQRDLALDSTFELEGLQARAVQGARAARLYGSPFLHQEVLGKLPRLDLGEVSSLGYAMAERGHTFALLMKPQRGATAAAPPAAQEAGRQSADDMHGVAPDIQQTLALVKPAGKRELSQSS
ncbi:MAG TPA: insulinase family protein [Polyangiaceae bacterium]